MKIKLCPSCGAPIENRKKCTYCKSIFEHDDVPRSQFAFTSSAYYPQSGYVSYSDPGYRNFVRNLDD